MAPPRDALHMETCAEHGAATNLSCGTCGVAVCGECAVRTPLGISCKEHSAASRPEAVKARPPVGSEAGQPKRRLLLVGGVVLALVIAGVVFLRPSGDDSDSDTVSSAEWTQLASAGLTARTGMAFVSTGRGM